KARKCTEAAAVSTCVTEGHLSLKHGGRRLASRAVRVPAYGLPGGMAYGAPLSTSMRKSLPSAAARVVEVHVAVRRVARVEGDAEQTPLAAGVRHLAAEVEERPRQQRAAADD